MTAPPNCPPGKGPGGPDDDEAKRREQAIRQAMLNDLGIARVDELPLDEEHPNRDRGHRGQGGRHHNHRQHQAPSAPAPRRNPPRGNTGGRAWTIADAWQDAMDSGAFDDDDAEAVKGLDDLGGGRVYDSAARGPSQMNKVIHATVKILDQRNKRSGHQFGQPASSNKKMRFDGRPNNGHGRTDVPAPQRNTGQARTSTFQARAFNGRAATPSASSDARGPKYNPLARVGLNPTQRLPRVEPPRPQQLRQLSVPIPDMVVDPNAPLPFDLGHILFRTPVRFLSREINPAAHALIVLSAKSRPELGLFTVVIFNRIHRQYPLSSWYDYSTATGHCLGVNFQDGGGFQGYQLFFENDTDLSLFVTRIRSFLAGEYADQFETASTLPPAAASVSAANPAGNPVVRLPRGAAVPTTSIRREVPQPFPRSIPAATPAVNNPEPVVSQVTAPAINGNVTPVPVIEDVPVEQVDESNQDTLINLGTDEVAAEDIPVEQAGESDQGTLITLGADEADTVTLQNPSSATEELSTLGPYDYSEASPAHVSRDDIIATARVLLEWFLDSKVTGRTAGELVQTVEGIRAGVLQHIAANARAQGLGNQRIEELKRVVNDIFEAKIRERHAAMEAESERRTQYTADEMLAMRDAAVSPPDWLANIPYLPRPGSRARQTSSSSQGTVLPPQAATSATPAGAPTQSQYLRSASAGLQWALGGTAPSNPRPEVPKPTSDKVAEPEPAQTSQPETPTAQTVAPDAPRPGVTQDSGLQSSRWASDAPQRQHANYFTGPRYEKVWSRRSYLEDLAQLDPQTKIDAEPEDLLDFYFPVSNDDEAPADSAESQPPVDQDSQVSALVDAESGAPQTPGDRDSQVPTSSQVQTPVNQDGQVPAPSGTQSGTDIALSPDNIESLNLSMSRLSIHSPTVASYRHGQFTAQPSSSVIRALQGLRARAGSLSAQPASVPAAQGIPSQPMAPPQSASTSSARSATLPAGQNGQRSLHAAPFVSAQPSVSTAVQPPRPAQTQARAAGSQPAASAQPSMSARPAVTQAARPGLRGLGASRHSAGAAPSSAGKFDFHLPPSARK